LHFCAYKNKKNAPFWRLFLKKKWLLLQKEVSSRAGEEARYVFLQSKKNVNSRSFAFQKPSVFEQAYKNRRFFERLSKKRTVSFKKNFGFFDNLRFIKKLCFTRTVGA
jgi:hypothetical protein